MSPKQSGSEELPLFGFPVCGDLFILKTLPRPILHEYQHDVETLATSPRLLPVMMTTPCRFAERPSPLQIVEFDLCDPSIKQEKPPFLFLSSCFII